MLNKAVKVENISKKYSIGVKASGSLRETLVNKWGVITGRVKSEREEFWALRDVSFEVKQGEVLGIIGKNGAGKSTLLKVLSRITEPSSGRIEINGRVSSLLEVGTGFHPELSGRENIFLNGTILGMSRKEVTGKFDEIVDFSGVEKFIDTPVKHYSSGMYVRLAFSVAAHLEPDILILDEVLSVGDAEFQKKCLGKMENVSKKDGRSILFVSHNLTAISNLCDRVILLNNGKIICDGSPFDTINKYSDSTNNSSGVFAWDNTLNAPGNENVKLLAVRVFSNGKITSEIDIQDNFSFEFEYLVLQQDVRLTVYLHITDKYGTIILSAGNLDSMNLKKDKWFNQKYSSGKYITRCEIKGKMLNTGEYSINLCIQSDITQHEVYKLDLISFTIVDVKAYCKEYSGVWPGFVRPRLDWETKALIN